MCIRLSYVRGLVMNKQKQEQEQVQEIINNLTLEQLHTYFNDSNYLQECMYKQYVNGRVSIGYLKNLSS